MPPSGTRRVAERRALDKGGLGAHFFENFFFNGAIWCVLEYILRKFGLKYIPKVFNFYTKIMINYSHVG